MSVYAISDLHLPGSHIKPMDIFGAGWERHFEKISDDWRSRVSDEDVVLLPGDFSWAMTLDDAKPDIEAVAALPGSKILCRGNHDYWWSSITQVRSIFPKGMYALQNDCVSINDMVFCGTRGWTVPSENQRDVTQAEAARNVKLYRRELLRMESALKCAQRTGGPITALIHYPPFDERQNPNEMTALFEAYGVRNVVYGHLHGQSLRYAFTGSVRGVEYHNVSCDGLDFKLKKII